MKNAILFILFSFCLTYPSQGAFTKAVPNDTQLTIQTEPDGSFAKDNKDVRGANYRSRSKKDIVSFVRVLILSLVGIMGLSLFLKNHKLRKWLLLGAGITIILTLVLVIRALVKNG